MLPSGRVAIITRTKDRPILLKRCVRSVLGQTCQDWLHVIVNDGGDRFAVESIVALSAAAYRGRLHVIHNQPSVGMQNASNIGITATASEFVVIHDDDDSWSPTFLGECVRFLDTAGPESPDQGVAAQSVWVMEEVDSYGNVVELSRSDFAPFTSVNLAEMAARNHFPPIAFLYRRSAHESVGLFDQRFNELGDWDFNLRFLLHYDIGVLPAKLANYHWRHQARGSSYGNTVTDGLDSHKASSVRLQNHYLREDIRNGRVGLGFLMSTGKRFDGQTLYHQSLVQRADRITATVDFLRDRSDHFERITSDLTRLWKFKTLMSSAKSYLAGAKSRAVRLPPAVLPALPTATRDDELRAAIRRARVVSLDIFDTALLRLVRRPTDVFLLMQEEVRRLLGNPSLLFVDVRVAAERASRDEQAAPPRCDETTLDHIYDVLQRRLGCDAAIAQRIKELEVATERKLCYANPEILAAVGYAVAEGKQVVFTSDMYLPAAEVSALLQREGLGGHALLLSSELYATKHHGPLFDHLLERFHCAPGEVLHVGDNRHSDFEQPSARGFAALHWAPLATQLPLVDQHVSLSGAWDGDLASSVYTGLARRRRLTRPAAVSGQAAFWEMLGFEVMGPLYLGFVSWAAQRACAQKLDRLYFLARDGFHLVKVFELLKERLGLPLEAEYLYASRRLLNLPRITALDEEAFAFLMTPNPCMRLRHFFERLGLNAADFQEQARRCGLPGMDEVVTTKDWVFVADGIPQALRTLFRQIAEPILAKARQERTVLFDYLRERRLFEGAVGIVDIGWQASSLKSFRELLALAGATAELRGYYFGTWVHAQPVADSGAPFESFYVHLHKPGYRAEILAEGVELLESLFWAPYPTITGLRSSDGSWDPIYGEAEITPEIAAQLTVATKAAFEFVEQALDTLPGGVPPPLGYLDTVMERLWRYPRREEGALLGGLGLRGSYGGQGPLRHLARVPSGKDRSKPAILQEAYNRCYWKKGFLAQLEPAEAARIRL